MMTTPLINQIIRSKRRTLGLQINSQAQLIVRAPHRASMDDILRLVNGKLTWIQKHQTRLQFSLKDQAPPRSFSTGETFLVLGDPRPLTVLPATAQPLSSTETEFILKELSEKLFFT